MAGALGVFQDLNQIGSTLAFYAQSTITAAPGGGKPNATQLVAQVNRVTVVATAGDSVKLPPSSPGLIIWLANDDSTDAMQVYGSGSDTINGVATGTGISQLAGGALLAYVCTVAGAWVSIASSAAAITSGTIDNVVINNSSVGLTTAAAGNFTNVNLSGNLTVTGTSSMTGNMTAANITNSVANNTTVGLTTAVAANFTNVNAGNITVTGNTNVSAGNLVINGNTALIPAFITFNGPGDAVAGTFFIADRPMILTGVRAVAGNAGSQDYGLMLEKLTANVAPGSGNTMLTAAMNMGAGNSVIQVGTLNATVGSITLTRGDSIATKFSGSSANMRQMNVTAFLKPS